MEENGVQSPPPPYRPRSPNWEEGVVEGWEEGGSEPSTSPGARSRRRDVGVGNGEEVQYAEQRWRSSASTAAAPEVVMVWNGEEFTSVEHIEYR